MCNVKAYVRFSRYENKFYYIEVSDDSRHFNDVHLEIEKDKIPPEKASEAINRCDIFPPYVKLDGIIPNVSGD